MQRTIYSVIFYPAFANTMHITPSGTNIKYCLENDQNNIIFLCLCAYMYRCRNGKCVNDIIYL